MMSQVKDIKPAMKENIVKLLHTSENRVNIKARTHEQVRMIINVGNIKYPNPILWMYS